MFIRYPMFPQEYLTITVVLRRFNSGITVYDWSSESYIGFPKTESVYLTHFNLAIGIIMNIGGAVAHGSVIS